MFNKKASKNQYNSSDEFIVNFTQNNDEPSTDFIINLESKMIENFDNSEEIFSFSLFGKKVMALGGGILSLILVVGIGLLVTKPFFTDTSDGNVAFEESVDFEESTVTTDNTEPKTNELSHESASAILTEDSFGSDIEEETEYQYIYKTEAVEYLPDSDTYVGFKVCEASKCYVYGIQENLLEQTVFGNTYELSFNDFGCSTAALGTSYCEVDGEFEITAL